MATLKNVCERLDPIQCNKSTICDTENNFIMFVFNSHRIIFGKIEKIRKQKHGMWSTAENIRDNLLVSLCGYSVISFSMTSFTLPTHYILRWKCCHPFLLCSEHLVIHCHWRFLTYKLFLFLQQHASSRLSISSPICGIRKIIVSIIKCLADNRS